jgi:hypothetical protein
MRQFGLTIVSVLCALVMATAAHAAASGVAKGVNPDADALAGTVTRTLVVGSDINMGDKVVTGAAGLVQILFADNTKLVVGPNSSLLIDTYLMRNDGSASKVVIDMLGGSFRFVTGTGPKSAYTVNTPTGTIGVRGTAYDVFVDILTGIAYVLMYKGETILTDDDGQKEFLSGLCKVGEIDLDEAFIIGHADGINGDERDLFKEHFLFSLNQSQLLPEFRLPRAGECTRRDLPPANNDSLLSDPEPCVEWDGEGFLGVNYCDYPG